MTQKELKQKLVLGEISVLDFLKQSKDYKDYAQWCAGHCLPEDENSAEFYYDMTSNDEYDEAEVYLEMYP